LYLPFLLRPGPFRPNTLTRGDCGDDGLLILTELFSDGSRIVNIYISIFYSFIIMYDSK